MKIEFLLVSPAFERVVSPFIVNLKRLGITATIRTVDTAQYQNRIRDFDFDIVINTFSQSRSPGNEQRNYWSSSSADRPGSNNLIGVKDVAVDKLVEAIITAPNRKDLIIATRALDRVLLWNYFLVPQWHIREEKKETNREKPLTNDEVTVTLVNTSQLTGDGRCSRVESHVY